MIVVIHSSGQEEWESSPLTVSQGREDPAKSDMRDVRLQVASFYEALQITNLCSVLLFT